MDIQDLFLVAAWYIADIAYAVYVVRDMARDCHGRRGCITSDVLDFLAITALTALALSPAYAVPIILGVLLHMPWLLTVGFILNAGVVLIGEGVAYLSRFTTPHRVSHV